MLITKYALTELFMQDKNTMQYLVKAFYIPSTNPTKVNFTFYLLK